jgi:glycerol kinase
MNLHTLEWDPDSLDLCGSRGAASEIRPSSEVCSKAVGDLSGVPVAGVLGDPSASLFGHTCFDHGDMKNTYGNRSFPALHARNQAGDVRTRPDHHRRMEAR